MSVFLTGEMLTEKPTTFSGVEGEVLNFIFHGCGNFDSHFTNRFNNTFCSSSVLQVFFVFLWIFPK